jgi:hypothetical protein
MVPSPFDQRAGGDRWLRERLPLAAAGWKMRERLSKTGRADRLRSARCSDSHTTCRGRHMQYAMLIYETDDAFDSRERDSDTNAYIRAWRAYYQSLVDAGVYVGGSPLQSPQSGTTVRVRSLKQQFYDGPYAETKEQLGGFIILELPSLDAALEWASRCPAAALGAIEIRPVATVMHERVTSKETA